LRQRVLVAERDREHGVERDEEEDRQPGDARQRDQTPAPAGLHQPALNFDQASSQSRWPWTLSCSSSWFAENWSDRTTASRSVFGISSCLIRLSASMLFCGGV